AGNPGPGFARLLEFEVERARGYYEKSDPLVQRVDSVSRPSLVAMTRIYRGLLERIAEMGPRVLKERASLNKLEKIKLAGEGFFQSLRA
ncbi:MAG: squalene/phytoene synthase family protein, partial [Candidatus Eremiobacteraeota bacterium]|nr:squalene/phytoene synthase family protein [Candidatus Eremiobacteraeota bacterium]